MSSKCQRAGPSGWNRGHSCHGRRYGGLGGRGLLPWGAVAGAQPKAGCSRSGPPPPARCWWCGRRLRWAGGSPPARCWPWPAAAGTAAQHRWRPALSEQTAAGADGGPGGCCGTAKESWRDKARDKKGTNCSMWTYSSPLFEAYNNQCMEGWAVVLNLFLIYLQWRPAFFNFSNWPMLNDLSLFTALMYLMLVQTQPLTKTPHTH